MYMYMDVTRLSAVHICLTFKENAGLRLQNRGDLSFFFEEHQQVSRPKGFWNLGYFAYCISFDMP